MDQTWNQQNGDSQLEERLERNYSLRTDLTVESLVSGLMNEGMDEGAAIVLLLRIGIIEDLSTPEAIGPTLNEAYSYVMQDDEFARNGALALGALTKGWKRQFNSELRGLGEAAKVLTTEHYNVFFGFGLVLAESLRTIYQYYNLPTEALEGYILKKTKKNKY